MSARKRKKYFLMSMRPFIFFGALSNISNLNARFVWEIWPSSGNIILFRGQFITGSNPGLLLVALLCAIVPFAALLNNRPVSEPVSVSESILCIWFAITVVLILKLGLSDPGIIPRRCVAERIYSQEEFGDSRNALIDPFRSLPGGIYCHTCEIFRPPNASHCGECGNCVVGFDHHCAVLNNCIGQRNYPYFFLLMPCIFILAICFLFQIRVPNSEVDPDHGALDSWTFGISHLAFDLGWKDN
jgi:hypothetical protein